ncbi:hypothetical protein AGMMS50276_09230 [Synergistales bacterium]|nr:hypothetical protein AGMMS50276_09230 [Synergistales bacterium]
MADIKQHEPLWGSWYVDAPIGEGAFGKVYRVKKEEFGKVYYSAVKIISIPQGEAELRQVLSEEPDEASARSYLHALVIDIAQEIDLMNEFRGNSNIVSLEDHKIIERENEIGWDILIRMELLKNLSEHVKEKPLSQGDVVKLGIHICRALELCSLKKTIHRDIKPDNIFVSQYGEYKLGDFGIARQIERTMSGLSKKGTYTYMAPEVFRGDDYGASVDIYSLGIVMYRFLNRNRTPFLPQFPDVVTPHDRDEALRLRMSGEALPPIQGIDASLSDILLKACAFDRKDRFESATDMKSALSALSALAGKGGDLPAAPIIESPSKTITQAHTAARAPDKTETTSGRDASVAKERTEGVFATRQKFKDAQITKKSEPEIQLPSLAVLNKLSVVSGVFFCALAALSWFSGLENYGAIFSPLYAFCVAQCALRFRNSCVNAFFLSALLVYLSVSFLVDFRLFDYHLFIAAWSLLALSLAGNKKSNPRAAAYWVFAACPLLAGALIVHAILGVPSEDYHTQVVGAVAIPFLMIWITVSPVLLVKERFADYAAVSLLTMQIFPLIAFVLHLINDPNISAMFFIANANFIGISPERFSWWHSGRILAILLQIMAFVPFFLLALAHWTPGLFTRVFDRENHMRLFFEVTAFLVFIALLTEGVSVIPYSFLK